MCLVVKIYSKYSDKYYFWNNYRNTLIEGDIFYNYNDFNSLLNPNWLSWVSSHFLMVFHMNCNKFLDLYSFLITFYDFPILFFTLSNVDDWLSIYTFFYKWLLLNLSIEESLFSSIMLWSYFAVGFEELVFSSACALQPNIEVWVWEVMKGEAELSINERHWEMILGAKIIV